MDIETLSLSRLAVPTVCLLVIFLAYSSQALFLKLDPGPLNGRELLQFNCLVLCIWICYYRACVTDSGQVPHDWVPQAGLNGVDKDAELSSTELVRQRRCRKCDALKPPRSHHCKICRRCVPKMDHHCPWTSNCVSYFTFPHFFRFLFYAVVSMAYLQYLLFVRAAVLWEKRNLPSYLGPSVGQLAWLFVLLVVNSFTLFMLVIMLVRTAWSLGSNVTTIESWEIERHHQLLRRARVLGGYLDGPDGRRIKIVKQEFPYDIGIWDNIKQGMGTGNVLAWLWPFASSPRGSGVVFEENDFEDPGTHWPPPDPDRIPRRPRPTTHDGPFLHRQVDLTNDEELKAFKERQEKDLMRFRTPDGLVRRKPFHERYSDYHGDVPEQSPDSAEEEAVVDGEENWQDSGGNRLKDYGVEEDVEFYDEDDVPLQEVLRRKKLGAE